MRRFINSLIDDIIYYIALIIGILLLPHVIAFTLWLCELQSTQFGFPKLLDLCISFGSGLIATLLIDRIFAFFRSRDRQLKENGKTILEIVIGFVVASVVHGIIKYWYIILGVIIVMVVGYVVLKLIKRKKEK